MVPPVTRSTYGTVRLLPGFVDVRVHSSSLGAEGLARATAAAVGGVTTMIGVQFLYREAALLDAWRLEKWLALCRRYFLRHTRDDYATPGVIPMTARASPAASSGS